MYVYTPSRSIGQWIPDSKQFSKVFLFQFDTALLIRLCRSVRTNCIPDGLFMAMTLLMGHTHMHKQETAWPLRWGNFHANV